MSRKSSTGSSSRRSTQTRKKATPTKKTPFKVPIWVSILIFSLICAVLTFPAKKSILLYLVDWNCEKPKSNDKGAEVLYNVWNLNHQVFENENKKEALLNLLTDRVYWFSRTERDKEDIKFSRKNPYDCFCFVRYPEYDASDTDTHDYEITFHGFHRYRNPKDKLIKMQSGAAEIEQAKLKKITSFSSYQGQTLEYINYLYEHFFLLAWGICLILCVFIRQIPKAIVGNLIEGIFKRIF